MSLTLTVEQLAAATAARIDRADAALDALNEAMALFQINTPERVGMFLANIGHETGGLKWYSELWGPTPAQKRYERDFSAGWPVNAMDSHRDSCARNRLAWELGNVSAGDGSLFRGHGMLQTTGRFNHAKVRDRLRAKFPALAVPDFEHDPTLLAQPRWAALSAADYCDMKGCNAAADAGDFDAYADLVNKGRHTEAIGDANGYAQRLALWENIGRGRSLA